MGEAYKEQFLDKAEIEEIRGDFEKRFDKITTDRDRQSGEYNSQMTRNYWYGFLAASAIHRK